MTHAISDLTIRAVEPIVHREAVRVLEPRSGADAARELVRAAWRRYDVLDDGLPLEPTPGANVMVHLAALTLAFYRALVAYGESDGRARALVAQINWAVYEKFTALPWAATAFGGA